ncbi:hypothetical protein HN51_047101 [Arachis hypogaea]
MEQVVSKLGAHGMIGRAELVACIGTGSYCVGFVGASFASWALFVVQKKKRMKQMQVGSSSHSSPLVKANPSFLQCDRRLWSCHCGCQWRSRSVFVRRGQGHPPFANRHSLS